MKQITLRATLTKNGEVRLNREKLSYENILKIEKILNYTNQHVHNSKMIINDFRKINMKEYQFTIKFDKNLDESIAYTLIDIKTDDIDQILEACKAFKANLQVNTPKINLNPKEGEFGLVFDDKTLQRFEKSFTNIAKDRTLHKKEEEFKSKFYLNDSEFELIAAIAA